MPVGREWGPERGGNVTAVAMTANLQAEDRMKAVIAGFQHHVAKTSRTGRVDHDDCQRLQTPDVTLLHSNHPEKARDNRCAQESRIMLSYIWLVTRKHSQDDSSSPARSRIVSSPR